MNDPAGKSPEMAKFLNGLANRSEAIESRRCVKMIGCDEPITTEEFGAYGPQTRHEYALSGLCGKCQVEIMGGSTTD